MSENKQDTKDKPEDKTQAKKKKPVERTVFLMSGGIVRNLTPAQEMKMKRTCSAANYQKVDKKTALEKIKKKEWKLGKGEKLS